MSYDITITCPDGQLLEMNWLRNPFGLCNFLEDNVGDGELSLWHVCNDNSYETSNTLDRLRFHQVVNAYSNRLNALKQAFFYFDGNAYRQFSPFYPCMRGATKIPAGDKTKIDVEAFTNTDLRSQRRPEDSILDGYKRWMDELVTIAEVIQDPNVIVFISN